MAQAGGADISTSEALLEKARAMAPVLRQRAADTNKGRRVPEETIQDLWKAGLWYLLTFQPSVVFTITWFNKKRVGCAVWPAGPIVNVTGT